MCASQTEAGVNSWVIHANQQIFGPDAEEFRPERWLESPERASEMNRYIMTVSQRKATPEEGTWWVGSKSNTNNQLNHQFGAGSRTCIGKNISLLEISILIPELVRRFDFRLAHPEQLLEMENVWFVKQKNLECYVSLRKT